MKLKDRIRQALQQELEPLGFRYLKSTGDFKRSINKETNVYVYYVPDCFDRGITHVTLLAGAEYRDIEDIIYKQYDFSRMWTFQILLQTSLAYAKRRRE